MVVKQFTKYPHIGPSSRYRFYIYNNLLSDDGYIVHSYPLFDENYINSIYSNKRVSFLKILFRYFYRVFLIFKITKKDIVIIEGELFPYFPSLFEIYLSRRRIKYIVDYDDAIFHRYDMHSNFLVRYCLRNKIKTVIKHSYFCLCGNSYLAGYASKVKNINNIIVLPTVVDQAKYKGTKLINDVPVIGWIGNPSTASYIQDLERVFIDLLKEFNFKLHLIGLTDNPFTSVKAKILPWAEDTEIRDLIEVDIGIMPLRDSPWERGKCGFKLIQYMSLGKPVIASKVGTNCEIIDHGKNGFLCKNKNEWKSSFEKLLASENLRKEFGAHARDKMKQSYNHKKNYIIIKRLLEKCVES